MSEPCLVNDDGRECSKCRKFKSWNAFYKGKGPRHKTSKCNECFRKAKGCVARKVYEITKSGRECTTCGLFKEWSKYYNDKSAKTGYGTKCKECAQKLARVKNPQKFEINDDGRVCPDCKTFKLWSCFGKKHNGPRGHSSYCKDCKRARDGYQEKAKKSVINDIGRQCARCRQYKPWSAFSLHKDGAMGYCSRCKECLKEYKFLSRYGITLDEYNQMNENQSGLCAICGQPETRVINGVLISLVVDHCHETGRIRGLLCSKCNLGIGAFRDSPDIMRKAIAYLG